MLVRPALLLRIEEASLFLAAVLIYAHLHFSWLLFALLFFVPDLFMLGYLANPRVGAALYNLGHVLFAPLALVAVASVMNQPLMTAIAIIWFSHIAFDRLLSFGLKYPSAFKDTHLQRLT